jgi:hypothetical protein
MNEPTERWLPVVGQEGRYQVSDLGRVRSLGWHTRNGYRQGRILKPRPLPTGYLRVGFYVDGKQVDRYIHDLVAEAFIGPKLPGTEVRHGPGGKSDNSVANLSYGSHIENCEDRTRDKIYHHKLTRADATVIRRRLAAGELQRVIAADYGVGGTMISKIKHGDRWCETEPAST